jgi:hypothetical protein
MGRRIDERLAAKEAVAALLGDLSRHRTGPRAKALRACSLRTPRRRCWQPGDRLPGRNAACGI